MKYHTKLEKILDEKNVNKSAFARKIAKRIGRRVPPSTFTFWLKTGKVPDDAKMAIADELEDTVENIFFDRAFQGIVEVNRLA